jgi:hypothetical protein
MRDAAASGSVVPAGWGPALVDEVAVVSAERRRAGLPVGADVDLVKGAQPTEWYVRSRRTRPVPLCEFF